jgi:hypothetical protein
MTEETLATPTPSPDTGTAATEPIVEAAPVAPVAPVAPEPVVAAPPVTPGDPTPPTTEPAAPEAPPEAAPERVVPQPNEYVIPEGVPEEMRQFAHDNGFTQAQLDVTVQQIGSAIDATGEAQKVALRSMGEAHLKNWGDQADTNLNLAKQALNQNDPDGSLAKALNESGYGNHPAVLDFLHTLGKGMQEGGFLKRAVRRPPGQKSAAQSMYGANHPSVE